MHLRRAIEPLLRHHLDRGKSILLLGPRQTGKTTLLGGLEVDLSLSLVSPGVRRVPGEKRLGRLHGPAGDPLAAFEEWRRGLEGACVVELSYQGQLHHYLSSLTDLEGVANVKRSGGLPLPLSELSEPSSSTTRTAACLAEAFRGAAARGGAAR